MCITVSQFIHQIGLVSGQSDLEVNSSQTTPVNYDRIWDGMDRVQVKAYLS